MDVTKPAQAYRVSESDHYETISDNFSYAVARLQFKKAAWL